MPFQTHNPRQSDVWTVERIALLLKLDAEDILSRSQIANELHKQTGSVFSRNAIIGKLHRLGVPPKQQKPSSINPQSIYKRSLRRKKILGKIGIESPPFSVQGSHPLRRLPEFMDSLRLSMLDLTETTCRYPTSPDGLPIEFCGHPVSQRSYCAAHYRLCYFAPQRPRPDQSHRIRLLNAKRYKQSLLKPSCEAA